MVPKGCQYRTIFMKRGGKQIYHIFRAGRKFQQFVRLVLMQCDIQISMLHDFARALLPCKRGGPCKRRRQRGGSWRWRRGSPHLNGFTTMRVDGLGLGPGPWSWSLVIFSHLVLVLGLGPLLAPRRLRRVAINNIQHFVWGACVDTTKI